MIDHAYSPDSYEVRAYYSTGGFSVVTKDAKITGDKNVVVGADNTLTFKDDEYSGNHAFNLTVSYGGKTTNAVVNAYRPGDAIGGLINPTTSFIEGTKLSASFAGIKFLDKDGNYIYSSTMVPATAKIMIIRQNGEIEQIEASEGYVFAAKDKDALLLYMT